MSTPDDLDTVHVTGRFYDSRGESAEGYLEFEPSTQLVHVNGDYLISPTKITISLNALGEMDTYLYATDNADLKPKGWTWMVSVRIKNAVAQGPFYIQLPASIGSVNLASLSS